MQKRLHALSALGGVFLVPFAARAAGDAVTVRFSELTMAASSQVTRSGVHVTALSEAGEAANVTAAGLGGIGVAGGASDVSLDNAETLRFTFDAPSAAHAWISFAPACGGERAAQPATADITLLTPLGPMPGGVVDASEAVYITRLASGAPITGFEVRIEGGPVVVADVSYIVGPPVMIADFTNIGAFTNPTVIFGEVRVQSLANAGVPGLVNVLNLNGLGDVGGVSNSIVDGAETLRFFFDNIVPDDISWFVTFASNLNGNGLVGEAVVRAFSPGGASLGVVNVNGAGAFHLNSLFGGAPIKSFEIQANTDGHRVSSVSYSYTPTECVSDLNSDGVTNAADLALMLGAWGPCP